jgi:hypothetical protein
MMLLLFAILMPTLCPRRTADAAREADAADALMPRERSADYAAACFLLMRYVTPNAALDRYYAV